VTAVHVVTNRTGSVHEKITIYSRKTENFLLTFSTIFGNRTFYELIGSGEIVVKVEGKFRKFNLVKPENQNVTIFHINFFMFFTAIHDDW